MFSTSASPQAQSDYRLDRAAPEPFRDVVIDFGGMWRFLRRQVLFIVLCVGAGAVIAYLLASHQTKLYASAARVLYGEVHGSGQDSRTTLDTGIGETKTDAQIEIVRSEATLEEAVRALNLINDSNAKSMIFAGPGFYSPIPSKSSATSEIQRLVEVLQHNVKVERVGRTQILEITSVTTDPALAARIANAVAEAYVAQQLKVNADLAKSTIGWLRPQLEDLRAQAQKVDQQILDFKAEHTLLGPDGHSLSTQRLSDVNAQIVAAQSDVARLQAKQSALQHLLDVGQLDSLAPQINNQAVAAALDQWTTVEQRHTHLLHLLGKDHKMVRRVEIDLADAKAKLRAAEAEAVAASNQDVGLAQERLATLLDQLALLVKDDQSADALSAQLRTLTTQSETLHRTYQASLDRYQQSTQDESNPVGGTHLVESAHPVAEPISAKSSRTISVGAGLGLVVGIVLALLIDHLTFRPNRHTPQKSVVGSP